LKETGVTKHVRSIRRRFTTHNGIDKMRQTSSSWKAGEKVKHSEQQSLKFNLLLATELRVYATVLYIDHLASSLARG
jgi:hypothetical protein